MMSMFVSPGFSWFKTNRTFEKPVLKSHNPYDVDKIAESDFYFVRKIQQVISPAVAQPEHVLNSIDKNLDSDI